MADKNISRSSYDDYYETIKKITPQLKTILAHINGEQSQRPILEADTSTVTGGACNSKQKCSPCAPKPCSTRRSTNKKMINSGSSNIRRKTMYDNSSNAPQIMQAVTNAGKIVYGTMKDGKLEVQGTVGEIDQDLLGVNFVNGGKKIPSKKGKSPSMRSTNVTSTSITSKTKTPKKKPQKECCSDFGMD
ncbi:virion core and cleavage processing protein [Hypsugopox virus]|nr:virion core and cleavage processing protein [Hypsugopox virus]